VIAVLPSLINWQDRCVSAVTHVHRDATIPLAEGGEAILH
jgi:hypothetical protein